LIISREPATSLRQVRNEKKLYSFAGIRFRTWFDPQGPRNLWHTSGTSADNIFLITGIAVLGIWICQEAEKTLQEHDSPKIVVDEIAGYLIAVYTWDGIYLIIGFLLFRFLDILKPAPINRLQRLPGGLGVMADDLAAGLITNIIMKAAVFVFLT